MAGDSTLRIVHVEILLKQDSVAEKLEIIASASKWLSSQAFLNSNVITTFTDEFLSRNVISLSIFNNNHKIEGSENPKIQYHPYIFNSTAPEIQELEDEQQISTQWILPSADFHGLWDSLIYDSSVKEDLLNYVSTALHFSEKLVDPNIISWNRIVLLHGPPGTGKTSLCKALAQKISIRFSSKFMYGHLIEVNTHSLFSKWFSESGKLVTKMFHSILSLVEDPNALVMVLFDEVETLARSRASALGGSEPSDALRVVNALLTHLDMIKRFPNVLILTTSNITDAIDVALIDRADIKKYIGLPSVEAIYKIYSSCIEELKQRNIISSTGLLLSLERLLRISNEEVATHNYTESYSLKLKAIAEESIGLSGRSLRKMPFIACSMISTNIITLDVFLNALSDAVRSHKEDVQQLNAHA